jgi:uncharacterized protein
MSTKNIILSIVAVIVFAAVVYTLTSAEDPKVYLEKIEKEREKQFKYLRFNSDSPLTEDQKASLTKLSFYPISPEYKVRAKMIPLDQPEMIFLPLSDGTEEKYLKHSFAEFDWNGKTYRLLLLQAVKELDKRNFFLAFADLTSGEETYGGGRYLNLRQDGKKSVTIDFNLAYNPYCAYNPDYACPLPPKENILELAILAGEKDYIIK